MNPTDVKAGLFQADKEANNQEARSPKALLLFNFLFFFTFVRS